MEVMSERLVGLSIQDPRVPTPFVYVDLPTLDENIASMARRCRERGVGLRPHTKTHKIAEIARRQLDSGAIGLTVAKLGEAAALIDAGISTSYLIAQPLVGDAKAEWYAELTERCEVLLCVDDVELAGALAKACQRSGATLQAVLIVDAGGYGRLGVPPAAAVETAQELVELPGLRFRGIRSYPGGLYAITDDARAREAAAADARAVAEVAERLAERDLEPEIVSTGNTPGSGRLLEDGVPSRITELRPGNYVFTDRMQVDLGVVEPARNALRVVASVVSAPAPGRAVIDAGLKTLSATRIDSDADYGRVARPAGARLDSLWEECGRLRTEPGQEPRPGDRVELFPNHACEVPNLAEVVLYGSNDRIEGLWRPVARGKVW